MALRSSIVSHGDVDSSARETYGDGPVILRIGNGGAGATGLVQALTEDYLSTRSAPGSIQWVCNHSRNTQLALLYDYIDLALTYERDQEALAAEEGWSTTIGCAFHDHFVLAGPTSDPARVRNAPSVTQAFKDIQSTKSLFYSRADLSATMSKERSIWRTCQLTPWEDVSAEEWYKQSQLSPADALVAASDAGAYLLTDRSTLLTQTRLGKVHDLNVFFEPDSVESLLMNSCYALISATRPNSERDQFVDYLLSGRGQQVIRSFGRTNSQDPALFASVSEDYARSSLRGGNPVDGRWLKVGPDAGNDAHNGETTNMPARDHDEIKPYVYTPRQWSGR